MLEIRRAGAAACVRVAAEQSAGARTRRGCGGWGVGYLSVSGVSWLPAPPVLASTLHALLANGNIHLFVSANHGPVTHFLANESAACCPARRCRGDPLSPGVNPLIEFLHLDIDAVMSTRYVKTVPYVLAGGILYSSNVVSMHPPPGPLGVLSSSGASGECLVLIDRTVFIYIHPHH